MVEILKRLRAEAGVLSGESVRQLLSAALVLGGAILVVVAGLTIWLTARAKEFSDWVNHSYVVEHDLSDFRIHYERAEAARRGFLLTGDDYYLTIYQSAATDLPTIVEHLRAITADNPDQQSKLARLEPLLTRKLSTLEASVNRVRQGDRAGAAAQFQSEQDRGLVTSIRALASEMLNSEDRLLAERIDRENANADLLLAVVLISGLLLALLAAAAMLLMRRYAEDLAKSERELQTLNEGLEEAVRDRTAELLRANQEIQRFAYIVSHDLRAPLVNVMGFTSELEAASGPIRALVANIEAKAPDLLTRAAKEAVEADLPESIGFIRSSTKKMDRLINAILRLSREGRRTLAPEPIAMAALIGGIAETLRHQASERQAEIVIEGELPDLVSDRLSIEQVFGNLIENAIKYLKPGRPGRIVVRGRESGPMVVYEVEDNGRGVDPKDHERIFDLFRRSGAQDQPGEGIGLAHVRATVHRLGGSIRIESELDRGATFRISLPANLPRDQGLAA